MLAVACIPCDGRCRASRGSARAGGLGLSVLGVGKNVVLRRASLQGDTMGWFCARRFHHSSGGHTDPKRICLASIGREADSAWRLDICLTFGCSFPIYSDAVFPVVRMQFFPSNSDAASHYF